MSISRVSDKDSANISTDSSCSSNNSMAASMLSWIEIFEYNDTTSRDATIHSSGRLSRLRNAVIHSSVLDKRCRYEWKQLRKNALKHK